MDVVASRVLMAVMAVVVLVVPSACGTSPSTSSWDGAPFRAYVGAYSMLEQPAAVPVTGTYAGKVVFMKAGQASVRQDYAVEFERRHSALLAGDPEEVGAVVFVRERFERLGAYSGGGRALLCCCTLTVVDRRSGAVIARKAFTGGPPPTCAPAGMDAAGPLPLDEMMDFVAGLSAQQPAAGP